jgi:hypothetical protein
LLMGVVVVPANGALTNTAAASADGSMAVADAPIKTRRFNAPPARPEGFVPDALNHSA